MFKQIIYLTVLCIIANVICTTTQPKFNLNNAKLTVLLSQEEREQPLIVNTLGHLSSTFQLDTSDYDDSIGYVASSFLLSIPQKVDQLLSLQKVLIFINIDKQDKVEFCKKVKGCQMNIGDHLMAYIPGRNNIPGYSKPFHNVLSWPSNSQLDNATLDSIVQDVVNNHLLIKMQDYSLGAPISNLIPPLNDSIPFGYYEGSLVNQYTFTINNQPYNQFSFRIDNHFYFYHDNVYDNIYFVLLQNGYISPGTESIMDPTQAIGFYQSSFGLNNGMTYNGGQLTEDFNLESTSPTTIDQNHQVTDTSTTTTTLHVGVTANADGGGTASVDVDETWSSVYTDTETISDWGVVEDTNPATMASAWTWHQQYPYDIYSLVVDNFPTWWEAAYTSNGQVLAPSELATNTLQFSSSTVWRAASSLIDSNNQLLVDLTVSTDHEGALVSLPCYLGTGHHKLFSGGFTTQNLYNVDLNYLN